MKKRMLIFPVYLVLFSFLVLCLMPNSAVAEGDGAWTTATNPGYIFQTEEDLLNNQKQLAMTVMNQDDGVIQHYLGPVSGSDESTYRLKPWKADYDYDMEATWKFNSVTQATVTVESCSTNCLWQSGQVVTLNKVFGDMKADAKIATRVPKTGQTGCWNESGKAINCADTGQDGEYQLGVLPEVSPSSGIYGSYTVYGRTEIRFTDNVDGTVTDNLTGLIWLKNANCFGWRTWTEALNDCNNLANGSCGLSDGSSWGNWRLPNINELHSLVDPTQSSPALPDGQSFTGVQTSLYWSSTTHALDSGYAWGVNLSSGSVGYGPKSLKVDVWPVRSGN